MCLIGNPPHAVSWEDSLSDYLHLPSSSQPSGATQSSFIVANLVQLQEMKAPGSHGCRKSSDDTVEEAKHACCICTGNTAHR